MPKSAEITEWWEQLWREWRGELPPGTTRAIEQVLLLKAAPHQWGTGKIHQINTEDDSTLCGQSPARCPGKKFYGAQHQITCIKCQGSLKARADAEIARQRWAERQREWEEGRYQRRLAYYEYLQSPEWREKRAMVLRRAGGLCEGCGKRRAVQVHHLRYPRDCLPGSAQWRAQEKLFDLRAVCEFCHEDVHS